MARFYPHAIAVAMLSLIGVSSSAQGVVDVGLFHVDGVLEVRLRPTTDFDGVVSSAVFALRWDRNSDITLGDAAVPDGTPLMTRKSGQLHQESMFNYLVFAGFGFDPMVDNGGGWQAGHEYTVLTIPVTGTGAVELVNDEWTGMVASNADYFVSLGGHEKTGTIYKGLASTTDLSGTVIIKPNPNEGIFQFSFISDGIVDVRVEVVNTLGQSAFVENLRKFQGTYVKQMDLTNMSDGIYYLKITRGDKTSVHKIVYH